MAYILVVHSERGPRKFVEARAGIHHEVKAVGDIAKAIKLLSSSKLDLIIAELNTKRSASMNLLRHLKRNRIDVPVVLTGAGAAGLLAPVSRKLGAAAFMEYPMEQETLDRAISKALQEDKEAHGAIPPITEEEHDANISQLEQHLNRQMVCFAGKNQVYIRSIIEGAGRTSKPRVALKCALRKQFGYPQDVFFEYIRDVCCGDPTSCPAHQEFKAKNSA